jgi:phage FluMu protein Com
VDRQHLGGAASSVHKKIRCPRCKTPFNTLALVMEHQEITPEECTMSISDTNLDDISIESWTRINREVSRKGYDQLPQDVKGPIEIWVSANIGDYAQNRPIDDRQSELRKWYMVWLILHPGTPVPNHPCKCSLIFLTFEVT